MKKILKKSCVPGKNGYFNGFLAICPINTKKISKDWLTDEAFTRTTSFDNTELVYVSKVAI